MNQESHVLLPESDFNVFRYECFIQALNGFLEYKRRNSPSNWSMGAWSKRLNLANTASLSNILSKRKSVSRELGQLMINSMGLNDHSSEYLSLLLELVFTEDSHPFVIESLKKRLQELRSVSVIKTHSFLEESSKLGQ